MNRLQRDTLPKGGFAGLTEHRLVKDPRSFGPAANEDGSWPGVGQLVYLADARFMPHGETEMHNHHEVDVISVLVDGRIAHEGSLGHGQDLSTNDVQVQRAGGAGFSHNEINPDDEWNRLIQLWVLPEQTGLTPDYCVYQPEKGGLNRIYGGEPDQGADFPAKTRVEVALLDAGQQLEINTAILAYITRGQGIANGETIRDGDLIRADSLKFEAGEEVQLIVVYTG